MFSGGTGTQADPYLIATAEDLNNVRNYLSAHFLQINDIDLSEYENWEPIGDDTTPFTGSYDGGNYNITNLMINRPELGYVGFFGYCYSALLKNCNIHGSIIGGNNCGGLAGYAFVNTDVDTLHIIDNCHIYVSIEAFVSSYESCIGGIIGRLDLGDIFPSNTYPHISNCSTENTIEIILISAGGFSAGGCIGYVYNSDTWFGSDNYSNISKLRSNTIITINDTSYNLYDSCIGGLIGFIYNNLVPVGDKPYINNCYSEGSIIYNMNDSDITTSGFIAKINRHTDISNCYCIFNIHQTRGYITGFIGRVTGTTININNCYCVTDIDYYKNNVGSFLLPSFYYTVEPQVVNCYYDYDVYSKIDDYATPKTTSEMKQQLTFENWDFDTIWGINPSINNGYPYLFPYEVGLNVYVITNEGLKQAKKICIITDAGLKEIKKLNVITDTGLK